MAKQSARPSQNGINWSNLGQLKTPVAKAVYVWLREPDTQFTPKYSITVEVDPSDPEWTKLLDDVLKFENDHRQSLNKKPLSTPSMLRDDNTIQFYTTQIDTQVKCADVNGNDIPASRIWQSDYVKVYFLLGGWFNAGNAGARGYLSGVQLVKDGEVKQEKGTGRPMGVQFDVVDVDGLLEDNDNSTNDTDALERLLNGDS